MSAMSVVDRVAQVAPGIIKLMTDYKVAGDAGQQHPKTVIAKIRTILKNHDLMYSQILTPEFVCTHPDNRYGQGVTPSEVHELLERILAGGWDPSAIEGKPVGLEMPPIDTAAGQKIREWNGELVQCSDGLLAPVGDAKVAMFATSHTMAGLKATKSGQCRAVHSRIKDPETGRLSYARLKEVSPDAWEVCESGIRMDVVRSRLNTHTYVNSCCIAVVTLIEKKTKIIFPKVLFSTEQKSR